MKAELDGVFEKYHETLACMLGNNFFLGSDEEKAKVSEAISEVINLVMDTHGANKGETDVPLPITDQQLLKSMSVPNWVFLYFKLRAKLLDAARQTLFKLTQLERCGVNALI